MKKKHTTLIKNPFLIWLAVSFVKMLTRLAPKTLLHIGKKFGQWLQKLLPKHRKMVAINLKLCFPEKSDEARTHLANQYFESFGMGLLECCMAAFTPEHQFPSYQVHGLEHIEPLIKAGRPVLLISAHFSTMVMMGRLIAKQFPFDCVFRLQRDSTFNDLLIHEAAKHNVTLISPALSQVVESLSQPNKTVLYFVDQDHGKRHSVFAPFFGVQTATIKALPFLANSTEAAIVPVFCYRQLDPVHYDLTFLPPLTNFPTDDGKQDAQHINQILEAAILKQPDLFFWYYKRFRTRPEGEASVYG